MARLGLACGLVLGLAVGVPETRAETRADPWAGVWAGAGEDNRGDKFEAKVTVHADGSVGIAYDGVLNERAYQCSGVFLPLQARGRTRLYREKIVFGTCLDKAEVRLTERKGSLSFAWSGMEDANPVTASAVLARR